MQGHLQQRGLSSTATAHNVTQEYIALMGSVAKEPYAVFLSVFFAIEHVYNQVRGHCMAVGGQIHNRSTAEKPDSLEFTRISYRSFMAGWHGRVGSCRHGQHWEREYRPAFGNFSRGGVISSSQNTWSS